MKTLNNTELQSITGGTKQERGMFSALLTAGIGAGSYALSQYMHHKPIKAIGLIGSGFLGALSHILKPLSAIAPALRQ